MSSGSSFAPLILLFLVAVIHGQESSQNGPTAIQMTITTNGILGAIEPYLWPVTSLIYQVIDSILRNVFQLSLPCTIYSFTNMDIQCTPVTS